MPILVSLWVVCKGFRELTRLGHVSLVPERLIITELEDYIAFSHCIRFRFCVPVAYLAFFFSLDRRVESVEYSPSCGITSGCTGSRLQVGSCWHKELSTQSVVPAGCWRGNHYTGWLTQRCVYYIPRYLQLNVAFDISLHVNQNVYTGSADATHLEEYNIRLLRVFFIVAPCILKSV